MKFNLTYSKAREAADAVLSKFPQHGKLLTIENPGKMFDEETFEPLDLVAMIMVEAGFDVAIFKENSEDGEDARKANKMHLGITGYEALFYTDSKIFCGPNFAVKVYLSGIARNMDNGSSAHFAEFRAQRTVMESYKRDAHPYKAAMWGLGR